MHRAVLIKIGHAHQVGKLLAPEIATVFGAATGAAVKHRVGQAGAKHQHLAAGASHRLMGRGGFRLDSPVNLARHGGAYVKSGSRLALTQGIGAGRHRLGPQGCLGPARRHLTSHNAGKVCLESHMIDGL